jgi:ABC-type branched-subunit amino acid transport system ATPase component
MTLIDEPELLLHPSYIEDVAESIKKLRGNHITTILLLTLQLSHFIREEETVSLVVMQKEEEGERKG